MWKVFSTVSFWKSSTPLVIPTDKQFQTSLLQDPRWIPQDYDRRLLSEGGENIGRELSSSEKRRMRNRFRENLASQT